MFTNAENVFDIARANYKILVGYCRLLQREGYFVQAEKIIKKNIFQCLDYYIQSILINVAVFGKKLDKEELNFILTLTDSNQYEFFDHENNIEKMIKQSEFVLKSPPIIMQLLSLRDRDKNSLLSNSYLDILINLLVAFSYLNSNRHEYMEEYLSGYFDSVRAFLYLNENSKTFDSSYFISKVKGEPEVGSDYRKERQESFSEVAVALSPQKEVKVLEKIKEEKEKLALSSKKAGKNPRLDKLIADLEKLIGLSSVKTEVHSLINLINIRQIRKSKGLPSHDMSYHMVFTGSPGTGKTTVARLIADIYKELGVLSKGGLTEVDRSGLVAGYVGQTAIKVSDVVKKALGGVLFIDEAYSLAPPDATNDFGSEAIDTLVKLMEDNRDDLVVIVAGYTKEMTDFLNANTGLISRFNKFIEFLDYTDEELIKIMLSMADSMEMKLSDCAIEKLRSFLSEMDEEKRARFGNARGIRNLFEKMLVGQANRLALVDEPSIDDLSIILGEDF